MHKIFLASASVMLALGTHAPAFAKSKPKVIFAKAGSTPEQRAQDSEACDVMARNAKSDLRVRYYTDPKGGAASKAAASFGAGVAQGYAQRKEEFKIIEYCLIEQGYQKSWLTDEEMIAYKSLKKKARWPYLQELANHARPAETLIDPKDKKD